MKAKSKSSTNFKLHIFVLSCLAITQPLLDVISKNAAFLVAQQSGVIDVAILLLVLIFLVPAILVLPGLLAGLHSSSLSRKVNYVILGILISLLVLIALKSAFDLPNSMPVFMAIGLGPGLTLLYRRFDPVRSFCDFLAPAILIVPALFIFNSDVSRAVTTINEHEISSPGAENAFPVVMVVFDELPLLSLLDESGDIDSVRYPNFSALASESHWFRNARSVAGSTVVDVPAILSSTLDLNSLPVAADYPDNLFTLLSASHELMVTEQVTSLCPEFLCKETEIQPRPPLAIRQRVLLEDLSVVYLHILLPQSLRNHLPSISQSWGNFLNSGIRPNGSASDDIVVPSAKVSRDMEFARFVDSIGITDQPALYFLHTLLPHFPWEYLPTGKRYLINGSDVPLLDLATETWSSDPVLVNLGYQRHLLQVRFSDKLLGDLLGKLKAEGLFDESLLVIVADHGANFTPGEYPRRLFDREQTLDLRGVPLFIKEPHQSEGHTSDREASLLDILPTIANIMGIPGSGKFQGRDLFSQDSTDTADSVNPYPGYPNLERKLALFGSGDVSGLYSLGEHRQLLGRSRNDIAIRLSENLTFEIDRSIDLAYVDLDNPLIPAQISGKIKGWTEDHEVGSLALMLNGRVVATSRPYKEGADLRFSILVPEAGFTASSTNNVELFRIQHDGDGLTRLEQIGNPFGSVYRYNGTTKIEQLFLSDNTTIDLDLVPDRIRGYLDGIRFTDGFLRFNGWAADVQESEPATALLLDINGELIYLGSPDISRPGVAATFQDPLLENSGYTFHVPVARFENLETLEIKLLGINGSEASVLRTHVDINQQIFELLRKTD